jgi:hypothetical protein
MITLTTKVVTEELLRISNEQPDTRGDGEYRDRSDCAYVYPDGGRCIVGQLMYDLGLSDEAMAPIEGGPEELLRILGEQELVTVEGDHYEVLNILTQVQMIQDRGTPWGKAVEEGLNECYE